MRIPLVIFVDEKPLLNYLGIYMAGLDYREIKKDFPLLSTNMNGKPLVYLDSAASSQKPQKVIDAFEDYYRCRNANVHRGAYRLSHEATDLYDHTRTRLAKFLGAKHSESIIFTRNSTEAINLVAYSWGNENLKAGDEVLVSAIEHHSNLVPWMMLCKRVGAHLRYLPLTDDHRYDYSKLNEVTGPKTKLIALQHMSNAVGTIHDMKVISKRAKEIGAVFLIDGSQGVCHMPVDVSEIDCDFYAITAHKMLGPTGVGALYGRKELLEAMPPFLGGGDMILWVRQDGFESAPLPNKFEAGTPNIAGVVAFALALDYLTQVGLENIKKHEMSLLDYGLEELKKIPGISLYGTEKRGERGAIFSFNMDGVHPHDVGSILDEEGIAVRAGHHCCEPFMRMNNISGTVRASCYLYTGPEDIDALVRGLSRVREIFKSPVRV